MCTFVYRNSDMTEGRGPMVLDSVFTYRVDAVAYANAQPGVMGRKLSDFGDKSWDRMGDWQINQVEVFDSIEDHNQTTAKNVRAAALGKLTAHERHILGLDNPGAR